MYDVGQTTPRFLRRRRLLLGAAALCATGTGSRAQDATKPLQVGGLPVTCNLTLPVACKASETAGAAKGAPLFEFSKYSGWPETQGVFDERATAGRVYARAADHGPGR